MKKAESAAVSVMSEGGPFSTLVFVASLWYWLSKHNRASELEEQEEGLVKVHRGTVIQPIEEGDYLGNGGQAPGRVSRRGLSALRPVQPYMQAFFECLMDPCCADDHPQGHVALCIAEHTLVQEFLAHRLIQNPSTLLNAFCDSSAYSYNGFIGLPEAREAVAYFLNKRFLGHGQSNGFDFEMDATHHHRNMNKPEKLEVNPQHVAIGSGAASLLNSLFTSLCDDGDLILIPAPYYATFDSAARLLAHCMPYAVQCRNPVIGPTPEDLQAAYDRAKRQYPSRRVRAVLITHPNNPLGIFYRPTVLRRIVDWARSYNLHTIVDEIYALSQHSATNEFQSIVKVMQNQLGNDVHMLWGLSKDLGAAGFRFGVLYTQNLLLMDSLANFGIFTGVAHPLQRLVAELLRDDEFIDEFLNHSRQVLVRSYRLCTRKLDEMVIPYIAAECGMFVYADFSAVLPHNSETMFAMLVERYARVVLTPGQSQHDRKSGMFRICYAWVAPEVLQIAMERLSLLVVKLRRSRGATLNELHECLAETFFRERLSSLTSDATPRAHNINSDQKRERTPSRHRESSDMIETFL